MFNRRKKMDVSQLFRRRMLGEARISRRCSCKNAEKEFVKGVVYGAVAGALLVGTVVELFIS